MNIRHRATKINTSEHPLFSSASSVEEYRETLGLKYGFSPPVDYYVEGKVLVAPEVGKQFSMARDNHNGVVTAGLFQTSRITSVFDDEEGNLIFSTQNSIYKLEKLP